MTAAVTLPPPKSPSKSRPVRRSAHEFAFLPAALEVVETPPSPIGRAISGLIVVVFLVAILWASLSRIDIITVAHLRNPLGNAGGITRNDTAKS